VRPNSKIILPYEPGYTGHWEMEKRRKETATGCVNASDK
jgi:hypothetical protein